MKKVFAVLLTLIITLLTCALILSINIEKICINTLSSNIVKKQISLNIVDVLKETFLKLDDEKLKQIEINIQNSDEITNITKKYFDDIIESIINKEEVEAPSINDEIQRLVDENKKYLTKSQRNELVKLIGEYEIFEDVYESVANNLSDDQIQAINAYKFVKSDGFKIVVISLIIISFILIIIVTKSAYKWLLSLSVSSILSGLTILIGIPSLLDKVSNMLTNELIGKKTVININSINSYGYLLLIIGVISFGIFMICNLIKKKRK